MNLFETKNCSPTIYTLAALSAFGNLALLWDPLILRDAFLDHFDCKLSQRAFDKMMAGMSMVGTNLFNVSIEAFLAIASAYADKKIDLRELSYVSLKDCCWAVFAWRDLLGITDLDQLKFDPDIVVYINQLMNLQGISKLPLFMSFANLTDTDMTRIQEALVDDSTAFQAYNIRQDNIVNLLKAFIKDKQTILVKQLAQLYKILNAENPLKTAKK